MCVFFRLCVFSTLNCFFRPSTLSTTSIRADASYRVELLMVANYETEIYIANTASKVTWRCKLQPLDN